MPTYSLSHEVNRRKYARRVAASLRASWATRPVPGFADVLHFAAALSDDGWTVVFGQAGEDHLSVEPATRLEVLRALAIEPAALAPAAPRLLADLLRYEFGRDALDVAGRMSDRAWRVLALAAEIPEPDSRCKAAVRELLSPAPADLNDLLAGPSVRRVG